MVRSVAGNKKTLAVLVLVVAVIAVASFALTAARHDTRTLLPDDAQVVSRGQAIYAAQCASCHGKNLEGEPNWRRRDADGYLPAPPHDETGHTWHHGDRQLFDLTKHGLAGLAGGDYKTRMPTYDGVLPDQDIIAVLSFIKSRWTLHIRKRHDRLNAATRR